MKVLGMLLALAAGLAGARDASALSVTAKIQGNSCFNTTPTVPVIYSQWGPYNPSTTSGATVHCPVSLSSFSYTAIYVQVTGWSRNSVNKLSCTLGTTRSDGYDHVHKTIVVPYTVGSANTGAETVTPAASAPWSYLTCYIPPNIGTGYSYLSTIFVQAIY